MAEKSPKHVERLGRDERRDAFIDAVRAVVAECGISRLSISAVTKRAGCTRSLFYHYFPTKEDALRAALDQSIDAFMDQLATWNSQRVTGDIEGALNGAARMLKTLVLQQDDAMPHTVATGGNAGLYATFVHRVADRMARYICESTVVDFAALHEVRIDHLYETFYVLITGLIMFVRSHPDTPEGTIKDIIASTLHIEGYTAKYPERRPER